MKAKTKSKTKIQRRVEKKTNQELQQLIFFLKKQKKPVWITAAKLLSRPKSKAVAINLAKLNALTKENDVVIVPGKILGQGILDHDFTISFFRASGEAQEKLKKANCKILSLQGLVKKDPKLVKLIA